MKHLRRKRTTSTSSPHSTSISISVSAPAPLAPPDTPLHARFANTRRQDGTGSKPVVSGPIALAPRRAGQVPVPAPMLSLVQRPSFQNEREEMETKRVIREESKDTLKKEESAGEESIPRRNEDNNYGREQEIRRLPNRGEALAAGGVSGSRGEDAGVGMHGTRVKSGRVLLPARKVTMKRRDEGTGYRKEREQDDKRMEKQRDASPVKPTTADAGERVPLPARRIPHRIQAEEMNDRGTIGSVVRTEALERREQRREMRDGSPKEDSDFKLNGDAGKVEQARSVGGRVLLPAEKVTRQTVIAPLSSGKGSSSASNGERTQDTHASDPHASQMFSVTPFPSYSSPGSASTRTVIIAATSDSDGWEDKFSTPKRLHMHHLTNPLIASSSSLNPATSSSSSSSSGTHAGLSSMEPLDKSTGTRPSQHSPLAAQTSSTSTIPTGNVNDRSRVVGDRPRIIGDRVLLPARKVTRRSEDDSSSPERGRTMSTKHSALRRSQEVASDISLAPSSVPFATASVPASASAQTNVVPVPEGDHSAPKRKRLDTFTVPATKQSSTSVHSSPAPSNPSSSLEPIKQSDISVSTKSSLTQPAAGSAKSAFASSSEPHGRPPRRRKYSLLAAFGLPVSRAASDSDASSGPSTQHEKPPTQSSSSASPAPPASTSAPSTLSATDTPSPAVHVGATTSSNAEDESNLVSGTREVRIASSVTLGSVRSRRVLSNTKRPSATLQLQSLHLSGFDFPLDAILGDNNHHHSADGPTQLHPPDAPDAPPMLSTAAVMQLPPSPQVSKRRSVIVDSLSVLASSPDPPAAVMHKASSAKASPPPPSISNSQSLVPNPTSSPTVSHHPPASADLPVRQATVSPQPLHRKATAKQTRGIDPDHSLLPPESDTRYPIPLRRSPTGPSSQSRPHKPPTPPGKTSPTRSSPTRPEQHHNQYHSQNTFSSTSPNPNQRALVQGRPLIFAAMAAAEAEAEVAEPKAWMTVATAEESQEDIVSPAQTEHSNGSSQFVNGYPTPRSSSPKLPTATTTPDISIMRESKNTYPLEQSLRESYFGGEDAARRPPHSQVQSPPPPTVPGNLPTPPDTQPTRARKLRKSKSHLTKMADTSQSPSPLQPQAQEQSNPHPPNTLGAKPPTPVEDVPSFPRTSEGPSRSTTRPTPASNPSSALGSPFQMRTEKSILDGRHGDSSRSQSARVISSESPVPSRPVKVLTERQMEKLSATKGYAMHGSNGGASAQRRLEQPVPMKSPPSRTIALSPSASTDEPPAVQTPNGESGVRPVAPPPKPDDALPSTPEKKDAEENPTSPKSPEEYAQARSKRRGKALEKDRPDGIENVTPTADPPAEEEPEEPTFYPLEKHVVEPALFGQLLGYLSFGDWLALLNTSKSIRTSLRSNRELTERVLERFLRVVGYTRWTYPELEPLALTISDLSAYMHNVSVPLHQFARHAEAYLQTRDRKQWDIMQSLRTACRAYTRVVLRLRAQAEAEARITSAMVRDKARSPARGGSGSTTPVHQIPGQQTHPSQKKSFSRSSSRAPSPTSMFSHSQHGHGHTRNGSIPGKGLHHSQSQAHIQSPTSPPPSNGNSTGIFQSPLFRLRRAPLLQVYVPSPDGDWLSDASVLECEQELKRASVLHLLRAGDVVWDTAVGDEGNVGRLVWDGSYLIDLDYAYSRSGDLPKYLPTLAFPPSYFHRVVRTMGGGNPICHIDISPWGEEVANNLQLLQDRMKTETPQGGHHMVVRWVHRSSFTIRPTASGKPLRIAVPKTIGPGPMPGGAWLVDPGWYGTVVVEAEGTNEGLADLQERCRGAFPIRAIGANPALNVSPERVTRMEERRGVFRILREKSRPGEIWIKTVTDKERLLPP